MKVNIYLKVYIW